MGCTLKSKVVKHHICLLVFLTCVLALSIPNDTLCKALTNSTGSTQSGKITLFIQGFNNITFEPLDQITLYANVTYNNAPLANAPVAFQVTGAINITHPFTLFRTQKTNNNGIANMTFRIPPFINGTEGSIFGTWQAYATATIGGEPVQDTLTFQVKVPVPPTYIPVIDLSIVLIAIIGFLSITLIIVFARRRSVRKNMPAKAALGFYSGAR